MERDSVNIKGIQDVVLKTMANNGIRYTDPHVLGLQMAPEMGMSTFPYRLIINPYLEN